MALPIDHVAPWADGLYRFALPLRQLEELDDKTGAGPAVVLTRLMEGTWRLADLRETVRLGLIGGGTPPVTALTLVGRYVDGFPLEESVPLAAAILMAALRGRATVPAEPDAGNEAAAKSPSDPAASDPAGSTSPPSDATPS